MELTIESINKNKKSTITITCDEYKLLDSSGKVIVSGKTFSAKMTESRFEKFWEDYGRIGNKMKAREMYLRAIKVVTLDYLSERLKLYLKFLKFSGQYQMHASTWLNPRNREFDNDNVAYMKKASQIYNKEINYNEEL